MKQATWTPEQANQSNRVIQFFRRELSIYYFAVMGWFIADPQGEGLFSYHKRKIHLYNFLGMTLFALLEAIVFHGIIQRYSPFWALVLLVLTVYFVIWMAGDFVALRLNPIRLKQGRLQIRAGMRWYVDIPLQRLQWAGPVQDHRTVPDRLVLANMLNMRGNARLCFDAPVEVANHFGFKFRANSIDLQLDDPDAFLASLKEAVGCFTYESQQEWEQARAREAQEREALENPPQEEPTPPNERDLALIHAVKNGYVQIARTLLANGADVSVADESGRNALMWAEAGGDERVQRLLREYA